MAVNTILSSLAALCIFSSALLANAPGSAANSTDYLNEAQKAKVCQVGEADDLCVTAGAADKSCNALAAIVNGTNPKCVQLGVCSFVVVPSTNGTVPPSNTTTSAGTTTSATTFSTTPHTTTPVPPPVKPENDTVYVTDFASTDIPSNFLLISQCPNDGDYCFIYPK